jgi:hypothetical protein
MDRCCLQPADHIERDGLVCVAPEAPHFEIEVARVQRVTQCRRWLRWPAEAKHALPPCFKVTYRPPWRALSPYERTRRRSIVGIWWSSAHDRAGRVQWEAARVREGEPGGLQGVVGVDRSRAEAPRTSRWSCHQRIYGIHWCPFGPAATRWPKGRQTNPEPPLGRTAPIPTGPSKRPPSHPLCYISATPGTDNRWTGRWGGDQFSLRYAQVLPT